MELPEKAMLRSYHALDYDWTPLSRNPCWLSNVSHSSDVYMKRNRFALFQRLVQSLKMLPTNFKLLRLGGKSIVDDFVGSGYCKCESSLWATIHWDLSRVLRFVLPWNFEIFESMLESCGGLRVMLVRSRYLWIDVEACLQNLHASLFRAVLPENPFFRRNCGEGIVWKWQLSWRQNNYTFNYFNYTFNYFKILKPWRGILFTK